MSLQSHNLGVERTGTSHTCYVYRSTYVCSNSNDQEIFRDVVRILLTVDSSISSFPSHGSSNPTETEVLVMLAECLLAHAYTGYRQGTGDVFSLINFALRDWRQEIAHRYKYGQININKAWRNFASSVNKAALVRLSPYYFALKSLESGMPARLPSRLTIRFGADEIPIVGGAIGACQKLFNQIMDRVVVSATIFEFWFDENARRSHSNDLTLYWNEFSVMEQIASSRAVSTLQQRQLMDRQGRVKSRDMAHLATCAEDAAQCGVLLIEDFLDEELCTRLCRTFADLEEFRYRDATIDPYWNDRALWFVDIKRNLPEVAQLMLSAQRGGLNRIRDFFRLCVPIYADMLQLLQWPEGIYMAPHADNAHWTGDAHLTPYRDFAGIIYLNDDFVGGEIFLTRHNLLVKPRRGMLLAFTGGFYHEHGVTRVEKGKRITMPFFMTFSADKQDPTLS